MSAPLTVAIMQPYFIPYAGYFRLFAASDLFVVYDCVQFPRRGWVHRNRLVDATGTERWLTLPLAKASRDVRIRDLRFADDAREVLGDRMRPLPVLATGRTPEPEILELLRDVRDTPVDYIERLLRCVVTRLGLTWNVVRSSTLGVPDALRGQDRILEIARRVGASRYVNAPGGRNLYDTPVFARAGVELRFLSDYAGSSASIVGRMLDEDISALASDIRRSSQTDVG